MNEQKKVAFVLGGMSFGGAERVISILANHYAQKGWQVDILTLLKPDCDFSLHPSIRHIHLGPKIASRALRAPLWLLGLRRYISRERPAVIVSFAARINLLVLGANMFCGGKKRRVVISERNDPTRDTRTAMVRKLTRLLYPRADAIVFQTRRAMNCFAESIRARGRIIANPVTAGLPAADMSSARIVAVGKLMRQKNHAMLIRAFARICEKYPQYTLHIYGDGPLREELQALIDSLGLPGRAVLEGWHKDVAACIANAALFVLPSDYEGLSNALMEAVTMGLACVSTDCAGAQEMIEDGAGGLITPVGDEAALAAAMERMLADPAFRAQCGAHAKQHAASFAPERILALWEDVIEHN